MRYRLPDGPRKALWLAIRDGVLADVIAALPPLPTELHSHTKMLSYAVQPYGYHKTARLLQTLPRFALPVFAVVHKHALLHAAYLATRPDVLDNDPREVIGGWLAVLCDVAAIDVLSQKLPLKRIRRRLYRIPPVRGNRQLGAVMLKHELLHLPGILRDAVSRLKPEFQPTLDLENPTQEKLTTTANAYMAALERQRKARR